VQTFHGPARDQCPAVPHHRNLPHRSPNFHCTASLCQFVCPHQLEPICPRLLRSSKALVRPPTTGYAAPDCLVSPATPAGRTERCTHHRRVFSHHSPGTRAGREVVMAGRPLKLCSISPRSPPALLTRSTYFSPPLYARPGRWPQCTGLRTSPHLAAHHGEEAGQRHVGVPAATLVRVRWQVRVQEVPQQGAWGVVGCGVGKVGRLES
jgi:hypothetical protein